jgi:hypothetical protein
MVDIDVDVEGSIRRWCCGQHEARTDLPPLDSPERRRRVRERPDERKNPKRSPESITPSSMQLLRFVVGRTVDGGTA